MRTINSKLITGLTVFFAGLGTVHAAPAVLFSVDTVLREKGLFNDTVQERASTVFGASGSWSDTMTNLLQSGSGTMTAEMSGLVSFANGVLTASQHGLMNYMSEPRFTFFGDNLFSSIGINAYVLGAPGTAYSLTVSSDASIVNGAIVGPVADYHSIGWADPGWFYNWGAGQYSFAWDGVSTANTIQYEGQTYSMIHQVKPSLDSHVGFAMTNSWAGDSTATVDAAYRFSITTAASVMPSAVPEPETAAMILVGLAVVGRIARRRRAV